MHWSEKASQNLACITSRLRTLKPGTFETVGKAELQNAGKVKLVTIQGKISIVLRTILISLLLLIACSRTRLSSSSSWLASNCDQNRHSSCPISHSLGGRHHVCPGGVPHAVGDATSTSDTASALSAPRMPVASNVVSIFAVSCSPTGCSQTTRPPLCDAVPETSMTLAYK